MHPHINEIQIARDKGQAMEPLEEATVIETGIDGDRYAIGKGAFSKSPPPRNIDRHITLIESEMIDAVRLLKNLEVTFADTRRNLLTIGIHLNDLVGKQFLIGEVLVEGVELCDPCDRPGILSGKEDLRQRFKDAFENCGGLRVRVLKTGVIKKGDAILLGSTSVPASESGIGTNINNPADHETDNRVRFRTEFFQRLRIVNSREQFRMVRVMRYRHGGEKLLQADIGNILDLKQSKLSSYENTGRRKDPPSLTTEQIDNLEKFMSQSNWVDWESIMQGVISNQSIQSLEINHHFRSWN